MKTQYEDNIVMDKNNNENVFILEDKPELHISIFGDELIIPLFKNNNCENTLLNFLTDLFTINGTKEVFEKYGVRFKNKECL